MSSEFRLGEWLVQPELNDITQDGRVVHLEPRAMQVLVALADCPEKVLAKEEILRRVWAGAFVTDEVLTNAVWELRRALGDDARSPRFIQTVPRKGYRLVAPVVHEAVPETREPAGAPAAAPDLRVPGRWGRRPAWVVAALLLSVTTVFLVASRRHNRQQPTGTGKNLTVAVLSFDNATKDPELSWLGSGLSDMLVTNLDQSPHLQLISPEVISEAIHRSAGEAEGSPPRPPGGLEIGRRVQADVVITGRVLKAGETFRVDARIYDLKADTMLKALSVEGSGQESVLRLAGDLSSEVRAALEIEATGAHDAAEGIARVKTGSVEAYKFYVLGSRNIESFDMPEAIANLRQALEVDPQFAAAHDLLAYAFDYLGEKELARDAIRNAVELAKDLPEVERLKILRRQAQIEDDPQAELEYLQQLAFLQPDEAQWRFYLGWVHSTHFRNCGRGLDQHRRAVRLDPERRPLYYGWLGLRALSCGRPEEGLQALQRYVALRPREADAHDQLGLGYLLTGDYDRALSELSAALEIKPDHPESILNLGDLYLAQGMTRQALRSYEMLAFQTLGRNEEEAVYYHKAKAHLAMGQPDVAIKMTEAALISDPGMIEAYWLQGRAEIARGRAGKAREILSQMQSILEESHSRYRKEFVHDLRARLALVHGDSATAVSEFEKAIELGSQEISLFLTGRGQALAAGGDRVGAVEALQRSLAFNPNDAEARWLLGRTYEKDGEWSKAVQEYRRFLEIYKEADIAGSRIQEARRKIGILSPNFH